MKRVVTIGWCLILLMVNTGVVAQTAKPPTPATPPEQRVIDLLDFKEVEIADVVRTISTGYNINVILDKDVSGKVTVRLANVPVMEGLETICANQGLEVVREGSVYRIRKKAPPQRTMIRFIRGKLTVDIQDMDVKEFLKELSNQAAVSIVPDAKISGKVTGKLYQVELEDGMRALLEGNGFSSVKRKNIFYVGTPEGGNSSDPMAARRVRPTRGGGGNLYVDYSDGKVSIEVTDGKLEDVIKAIGDQSEIEIITYGNVNAEVNAKIVDAPLSEALALLLGGTGYTFIQRNNRILIGDRNPGTNSGQALSKSELVHLQHIKADEAQKSLPNDLQQKTKLIKEQNALLVTGTSEDIVKMRDFLGTIDLPTPQVIVDALVVEYVQGTSKNMGFRMGMGGPKVSPQGTYPELQGTTNGLSINKAILNNASGLGALGKLRLPESFWAELKLLENQNRAKVLAQPSITVLNGNKAEIDVSHTQYFKITSGTADNPLLQFRPISFGINLKITPWISQKGQITAEISPVISNSSGSSSQDGYPSVFQRSINTTVRFEDGETLVLGGLLSSEVKTDNAKVPLLGDIPIIGHLFKTTSKSKTQTNLVIYITPRIASPFVDIERELDRFDMEEKSNIFKGEKFSDVLKSRTGKQGIIPQSAITENQADSDTLVQDFGDASETAPRNVERTNPSLDSTAVAAPLVPVSPPTDTVPRRTPVRNESTSSETKPIAQ